jgi:type IV secretory pathway VirJ component
MVAPVAMVLAGDIEALARAEAPTYDLVKQRLDALTLVDEGRVYEIADQIEERAKLIKQVVRDNAKLGPVPLSQNRELHEVMWGTEKVSPEAKAEIDAHKERLRGEGKIQTVKVAQVRVGKRGK